MPPLNFDPEATVEEIAGIGHHPRFNLDFERPVPKLLRRRYANFSFLFLGCNLTYS